MSGSGGGEGGSDDAPILKLAIDPAGIKRGADQAEKDLAKVGTAADRAAKALDDVAPSPAEAGASLGKVQSSAQGAAGAADRVRDSAGRAAEATRAWDAILSRVSGEMGTTRSRAADLAAQFQRSGVASAEAARKMGAMTSAMIETRQTAMALGQSLGGASAAFTRLPQAAQLTAQGISAASAQMRTAQTAADNASRSHSRFGQALGQVGFQAQDVATQIAMGQNALMAFGTQFAQLAGFFGTTGALVGAAAVIGVIGAQLLAGADAAQQLSEAIDGQAAIYRSATAAADEYRRGLDGEAETVLRLTNLYGSFAETRRRAEQMRLLDQQGDIERQQRALADQARGIEGMGSLPRVAANIAGMTRNRDMGETPQQVREAVAAVLELNAQGTATAETLANLGVRLRDAAAVAADALAPSLLAASRQVLALVPQAERLDQAARQNATQLQALDRAAGGAGNAAAGLRGQIGGLADEMRALARISVADPLAALYRQFGQVQERLAGLRRGGLEGLREVTEAQERQRAGEEAYNAVLREQREQLQQAGAEREGIEQRAIAAAEAARRVAQETAREEQRLARERELAQERQRAGERAEQEAARERRREAERQEQEARRVTERLTQREREQEAQIELMRAEAELAGASADHRERELAAIRERHRVIAAGGDPNGEVGQRAIATAQTLADVRRETEQVQNSWRELESIDTQAFDRIGGALTQALATGEIRTIRFSNIVRAAVADMVQQFTRLSIVNPLMNFVFGGTRGTLGGVMGGGGGAGAAAGSVAAAAAGGGGGGLGGLFSLFTGSRGGAAAGGGGGGLDMGALLQLRGLMSTNGGNLTTGIGFIDSAIGGVNSFLQTPLFNLPWGGGAGGAAQAAGVAAVPGGMSNAASAGMPFTVGNALSAVGYGFSAFQGFQRGGTGGTVQGVGNLAAMAMLATPAAPFAPVVALGSTLIGNLLGGEKRGFSGGHVNLHADPNTGQLQVGASGSKGFDMGPIISQVTDQVRQVNEAMSKVGVRIGLAAGAPYSLVGHVGGGDAEWPGDLPGALKTGFGRYGAGFTSDDPQVARALMGVSDMEEALNRAQWVKETYQPMAQATDGAAAFARALTDLRKPFDEAIAKAAQYGLATDTISAAMEKAIANAQRTRTRAFEDAQIGYADRVNAAGGDTMQAAQQRQASLALAQQRERQDFDAQMASAGFDPAWVAQLRGQMEAALKAEAEAMTRAWEAMFRAQREAAEGVTGRLMRAQANTSGSAADAQAADLYAFDSTARSQVAGTTETLRQLGMTADQVAAEIAKLNEAHRLERDAIVASYAARRQAIADSLDDRMFSLGTDTSTVAGAVAAYDRQAQRERMAAAKEGLTDLAQLERVHAAERARIIEDFAKQTEQRIRQMGGNIRAFLDGLRTGVVGNYGSPTDQFAAAQQVFGRDLTLARGGDADALQRIVGSADTLLSSGRTMFGSTTQFQQLKDWVTSALETLPATRSYDALILEELKKWGGAVDVNVDLAVVRIISETLNALPQADRDRLVQAGTIPRVITETIGRRLTPDELDALVDPATITRRIDERLGRTLTAAERAGLMVSADVIRAVQERLGRTLTPQEMGLLVDPATVVRNVEQLLARDLTTAERGALISTATVLRTIEQAIGRNLTGQEVASLIGPAVVVRTIEQVLGRSLTEAERMGLLTTETVIRTVEQSLGRDLTAAERALIYQAGLVPRTISQSVLPAEGAALIAPGTVRRYVEQIMRRNLSEAEVASLIEGGRVVRAVEQQIGRALTAAEMASLIQAGDVVRSVEQSIGRNLTTAERASLVNSSNITRAIRQVIGRDLTDAEIASLVNAATVTRSIEQVIGRELTAAERASLITGATISRLIEQSIGRDLSTAERASLIAGGAVVRSVEQSIGRNLTPAEVASLIAGGTVQRTIEQQIGRALTAGEVASLIQAQTVLRTVEQAIGRNLTDAEKASLVQSGVVQRTVNQAIETTETVQISRSIDDKISGLLNATNATLAAIRYAVTDQLAYLHNLADIRMFLSHLREMARGADGGVRVTTLQASGAGNAFNQGHHDPANPAILIYPQQPGWGGNWGGLEAGGWVGNGTWNRDSVVARYAGGGSIMLAGGEHVTNAPQAARYANELNAINRGIFPKGGETAQLIANNRTLRTNDNAMPAARRGEWGGQDPQLRALIEGQKALVTGQDLLRQQVARLTAAGERTANATEDTAAETRKSGRRKGVVGARGAV